MAWLIIGAWLLGGIGSMMFGYAAIQKAKAWRTWAERCDPKGTFHPPYSRSAQRNLRSR